MLSRLVRKPRPTSDTEHCMQVKHSLCHCRSSKEMYLAPARPAQIKQRSMFIHNAQVINASLPCLSDSSYTNANKGINMSRKTWWQCQSEWKTWAVTHWWWAWCNPHTSLHTGCWSIRGNRGSSPWRWSADLTAAFCSQCIGNTRGARVCLGRSLHRLWWPRGSTNPHKVRGK